MLQGSTSTNDNEVVVFPGLVELFAAENSSSKEIIDEIIKHITEIMASMVDVGDYSRRAIYDPGLITKGV